MRRRPQEPTIRSADVEELCAVPYRCRDEALAVARRLRLAGWVVIEHEDRPSRRPDKIRMVASVYHPVTYESPGDVLCVPEP